MSYNKHIALYVLAVLFAATGCKEEIDSPNVLSGNGNVSFALRSSAVEVKSMHDNMIDGDAVGSYSLNSEGDETGMLLVETVSSLDSRLFAAETRGTLVNDSNFDTQFGGDLYATAFVPGDGKLIQAWGAEELGNGGAVQLRRNDDSTLSYGVNYRAAAPSLTWDRGGKLLFFLQAPYTKTNATSPAFYSDGHVEFDCTTSDPANQDDFLFGSLLADTPVSGAKDVTLYHAFTAVEFLAGSKVENTTVNSVTIKGLYTSGHCSLKPASGKNSGECSVWTSLSYPKDFTVAAPSSVSSNDYLFFVPQNISEAVVEVNVTIGGVEETRTAKIAIDWKAGEIHTYTLDIYKVGVDVSDSATGSSAGNAKLVNTGNYVEYLRGAIVTTWNSGSGSSSIVVAGSNDSAKFTGLCPADNWIQGEDGFFYYKYPVKVGKSTNVPLFTTYSAPDGQDPFPGAHMEMQILVQGVLYDADKSHFNQAWGAVKVSGSEESVVSLLSTVPEE